MNDNELSLLQYARNNGLSRDYNADSVFDQLAVPPVDLDFVHYNLFDNGKLPEILQHHILPVSSSERWSIPSSAAAFLRDIVKPSLEVGLDDGPIIQRCRDFKLELPILRSDDRLDLQLFSSKAHSSQIDLKSVAQSLPQEPLPHEQSLDWRLLDKSVADQTAKRASSEKLQITDASLTFLKDAIKPVMLAVPDTTFQYVGRSTLRIPSPILPLSPTLSSTLLDENDYDVPFTSTPENPADSALKAVEQAINEDEALLPFSHSEPIESALTSVYFPTSTDDAELYAPLSPFKRARPDDFRLDTPLLPAGSSSPPFKKVRFDEVVCKDDPALQLSQASDSAVDFEKVFNDFVDLAHPAISAVENEQLQEADTTRRMFVPSLPPHCPVAPWDVQSRSHCKTTNLQRPLLSTIKNSLDVSEIRWRHNAADYKLQWIPVPHIGREDLFKDDLLVDGRSEYMTSLTVFDVSLDGYFWKPEGLRILDDTCQDDEDLEPAPFDPRELEISTLVLEKRRRPNSPLLMEALRRRALQTLQQPPPSLGANNGINSFFHLQTGQRDQRPPSRSNENRQLINRPKTPTPAMAPALASLPHTSNIAPLPAHPQPSIDLSAAPLHLFISTTLLSSRNLTSLIRTQLHTTTFLERDLSAHQEADLLPTPSSGIVLTTLQQIKQRPLPGSESQLNTVHSRILSLNSRYEHLVVLVSEGLPTSYSDTAAPSRGLDGSDAMALNALTNLGANLSCTVEVIFVPGGEAELARWAVAKTCRIGRANSLSSELANRLGDETVQEVWLREAGLNAFAAAVVVASGGPRMSGTARFVMMSTEERDGAWGLLLGERLVARVGSVLDQRWIAAEPIGTSRVLEGVADGDDMLLDDEGEMMLY
ncbi:hypothetical protein BDZ85DRAFT_257145 [Elsinoe ampelina]|uniref:Uncharacterized protein n=1 Tax=Elsinoe ampelina TaxID=302913 RepID=A0A6A6GMR8_9PEZI|nr:hypothetical protein BDZ85DRAFT_257145 [Elsinoe ampelina]